MDNSPPTMKAKELSQMAGIRECLFGEDRLDGSPILVLFESVGNLIER